MVHTPSSEAPPNTPVVKAVDPLKKTLMILTGKRRRLDLLIDLPISILAC